MTRTIATLVLISVATLFLSLFAGEVMFRAIDGYALNSLELVSTRPAPPPDPQYLARAAQYAKQIRLDPDFNTAWFDSNFQSILSILFRPNPQDHVLPQDWVRAVNRTSSRLYKEELQYTYNDKLVEKACASGSYPVPLNTFKRDPGFVYTFTAPDDTADPPFRFVPHWLLFNYVPNNFGFRGTDLAVRKPPETIRVAFLGQSNTQDGWPNLVGYYLNTWAHAIGLHRKFEIVNAGRAGVGIDGVARIMRYEVAPFRPDIVIVYVGATKLWRTNDVLSTPAEQPHPVEQNPYSGILTKADKYSALMNRISELTGSGRDAGEPTKPPHKLRLDLSGPVHLDQPNLPFGLDDEISQLRYIEGASRTIHADLFLSSSIVLANEELRLDLSRDYGIYDQLRDYWPLTYREIRLAADFENRAYRALAFEDHLGFLEIAKYFPQDPALFGDTIHLMPSGKSLQAWIVAQELAPVIRHKVDQGEWPTRLVASPHELDWVNEAPRKFDLAGCKT